MKAGIKFTYKRHDIGVQHALAVSKTKENSPTTEKKQHTINDNFICAENVKNNKTHTHTSVPEDVDCIC